MSNPSQTQRSDLRRQEVEFTYQVERVVYRDLHEEGEDVESDFDDDPIMDINKEHPEYRRIRHDHFWHKKRTIEERQAKEREAKEQDVCITFPKDDTINPKANTWEVGGVAASNKLKGTLKRKRRGEADIGVRRTSSFFAGLAKVEG